MLTPNLDHSRVVHQLRRAENLPLAVDYLKAVQKVRDVCIDGDGGWWGGRDGGGASVCLCRATDIADKTSRSRRSSADANAARFFGMSLFLTRSLCHASHVLILLTLSRRTWPR